MSDNSEVTDKYPSFVNRGYIYSVNGKPLTSRTVANTTSARDSILNMFDPICNPEVLAERSQSVDTSFIQLHSTNF